MKKLSLILAVLLALLPILSLAEETVPSADTVDAEALYQQGLACTEGEEPDYEMALGYLEKASDLGHTDAMRLLGKIFANGWLDGTIDYETAIAWLTKAADLGHVQSMYNLGTIYKRSDYNGGNPDYAKAKEWFLKAAELGNSYAMADLADLYYHGQLSNNVPDYEKAREWFEKSAAAGYSLAMHNLGVIYNLGLCNENIPEHEKAKEWYLKAAELGYPSSMFSLGAHYANGNFNNGIPDGETALSYYMQAWNAGYSKAEGSIINLLCKGITAEDGTVLFAPNHAKMLEFLNQMDQQGTENTYALSWLGWLLCGNSDQNVCEVDYARAVEVYKRGAALGSDYCMMRLGEGYADGTFHNGVPDGETALSYYMQAWNAGYHDVEGTIIDLLCKGITAEDGTVLFAPNHAKMLEFLNQMDQQGTENTYALSWLGWLLSGNSDQNVCEVDYARAAGVYQRGAVLGSDYCMMRLGEGYHNGTFHNGVPDGDMALSYYMQAWNAGYSKAEGSIIDLLCKGITAEDGTVLFAPNHAKMLEFLNQLDQQGTENTYALSWLGWLLCGNSDQNVCEADYARAAEVYQRGAELGSGYCMMQLGSIYEAGHLGEADLTAAEEWFAKAVEAGETTAQEALDRVRDAQAQ